MALLIISRWQLIERNWPEISQLLALLAIFLFLWVIANSLFPSYADVSSSMMRLFFLFIGAKIAGIIVSLLSIPDILGQIFFGVFYKNVGLGDFPGYEDFEVFLRWVSRVFAS